MKIPHCGKNVKQIGTKTNIYMPNEDPGLAHILLSQPGIA